MTKYVDNRLYGGSAPKTRLSTAVDKSEKNLVALQEREQERLENLSDTRNYQELSKMNPADMDWNQLEMWNELQSKNLDTHIKKDDSDGDDMSPLPVGISGNYNTEKNKRLHKEILTALNQLEILAADMGFDVYDEIKTVRGLLEDFIVALLRADGKTVNKCLHQFKKGVKKPIKKSGACKRVNDTMICSLLLDDGIKNIGKPGQELELYEDGSWKVK